eukprot:gene23219-29417_t
MDALLTANEECETRNAALTVEITTAGSELALVRSNNARYKQLQETHATKYEALREEVEQLTASLAASEVEIASSISAERDALSERLKLNELSNSVLHTELTATRDEVSSIRDELTASQDATRLVNIECLTAQARLTNTNEELSALRESSAVELSALKETSSAQILHLQTALEETQKQLEVVQKELRVEQNKCSALTVNGNTETSALLLEKDLLERSVSAFRAEVETLQDAIETISAEKQALESKLEIVRGDSEHHIMSVLESQLTALIGERDALSNTQSELTQKLQNLTTEMESQHEHTEQTRVQNVRLVTQHMEICQEKDELLSALQQQLRDVTQDSENTLTEKTGQLEERKVEITKLVSIVCTHETDIASLLTERETLTSQMALTLQQKESEFVSAVSLAEDMHDGLRADLHDKLQQADRQIDAEYTDLKEQMRQSAADADARLKALQTEFSICQTELLSVQAKLKSAGSFLRSTQNDLATVTSAREVIQSELETVQTSLTSNQDLLRTAHSELTTRNTAINSLEETLRSAREESSGLIKRNHALTTEMCNLNVIVNQKTVEILKNSLHSVKLRTELSIALQTHHQLTAEKTALSTQVNNLKSFVAQVVKTSAYELNGLKTQLSDMRSDVLAMSQLHANMMSSLTTSNADHSAEQVKIASLQSDLQRVESRLQKATQDKESAAKRAISAEQNASESEQKCIAACMRVLSLEKTLESARSGLVDVRARENERVLALEQVMVESKAQQATHMKTISAAFESSVAQYQSEIHTATERVEHLTAELSESSFRESQLTSRIEQYKLSITQLERTTSDLTQQIAALQATNTSVSHSSTAELTRLQTSLHTLSRESVAKEVEVVEKSNKTVRDLQFKLVEMEAAHAAQTELSELHTQYLQAKSTASVSQLTADEFRSQFTAAQSRRTAHQSEASLFATQKELSTCQQQLKTLKTTVSESENKISSLQQTVSLSASEIRLKDESLSSLQSQLDSASKDLQKTELKCQAFDAELTSSREADKITNNERLQDLMSTVLTQQQVLTEAEQRQNEHHTYRTKLETLVTQYEKRYRDAKDQHTAMSTNLSQLQTLRSEEQDVLEKQIHELNSELIVVREEKRHSEKALKATREELEDLTSHVQMLLTQTAALHDSPLKGGLQHMQQMKAKSASNKTSVNGNKVQTQISKRTQSNNSSNKFAVSAEDSENIRPSSTASSRTKSTATLLLPLGDVSTSKKWDREDLQQDKENDCKRAPRRTGWRHSFTYHSTYTRLWSHDLALSLNGLQKTAVLRSDSVFDISDLSDAADVNDNSMSYSGSVLDYSRDEEEEEESDCDTSLFEILNRSV